MLAALLLLLGLYAYFWGRLYSNYLLVRDDPANIAGTLAGGVRGWLSHGMAGYYHVYPEWPQTAFSNFYRPVWNLTIFIERMSLGEAYWAWFLVYAAAQYAGACLFLRLLRSLGTPPRPALLFAILFLFNPAFLNSGFIYPGFQFDVFVALLLLSALSQLFEGRCWLALALITAAVLTKETAIFAPVAAAITVFILKRDVKWSAAMLAPVLVWIAARWLAYHAVLGGTFASPATIGELLANVGKGLIVWPSGEVNANGPLQLSGAKGVALCAALLVNAALWAVLGYAAWQVVRGLRRTPWTPEGSRQAVLLIWTLGALSFCLLTRPQTRFGASFYVFLLLFLAYFLFVGARRRWLKAATPLLLSLVTLLHGGEFLRGAIANIAEDRKGETALFAALRSLPQDGRAVSIVNAPNMLSAPALLEKSWNLRLDLTFIDQFGGCWRAGAGDVRYDPSSASLAVEIPSCASYLFAGVPSDIQAKAAAGGFLRPGLGVYDFPDHREGRRRSSGDIDFGRTLRVRFVRPPGTILAYDWRQGAYRVLGSEPR